MEGIDFNKLIIETVVQPEESKLDFLKLIKKKSNYSSSGFYSKLLESYMFWENEINNIIYHSKSKILNPKDIDFNSISISLIKYKIYNLGRLSLNDLITIKPLIENFKENKIEIKLNLRTIAIIHFYNDVHINKENSNEIAIKYGHNSGEKLLQYYQLYSKKTNRIGFPGNIQAMKYRIELFEKSLEYLYENSKEKALKEIEIMKNTYKNENI